MGLRLLSVRLRVLGLGLGFSGPGSRTQDEGLTLLGGSGHLESNANDNSAYNL